MIAVGPLSEVSGIQFFDRTNLIWRVPERDLDLVYKNKETKQRAPIIIVWIGDIIRCLTGGYVKGTVHRVKLDDDNKFDRFSMPFFIRVADGVPFRCLNNNNNNNNDNDNDNNNNNNDNDNDNNNNIEEEVYENYDDFYSKRFKTTQCTPYFNYIPPY